MAEVIKGRGYTLTLRTAEVKDEVTAHLEGGMEKAVQFAVGEAKRALNRGQKTKGVQGKRGYYRVGLEPSAPGEPPKKVTTRLFQSINGKVETKGRNVHGYIGTDVEYARALELGFVGVDNAGRRRNLAPRPFLRPAVYNNQQRIRDLIMGG